MQTWALLFNPAAIAQATTGVSLGNGKFLVPLEQLEVNLPAQVWVLLFRAGTDNEGIYTITVMGENLLVTFADEDDATRYSLLLEAQDFLAPVIDKLDRQEIEAFCQDAGYDLCFVPEGQLAIPPEQNLDETDWQPDRKPEASNDDDIEAMRRRLEGLL